MSAVNDILSKKQVLAVCRLAGFRGKHLLKAAATAGAESAWDYTSSYQNANGSTDRGLFQINDKAHPDFPDRLAFLPIPSARKAYELSNGGQNWTPWYAYGGVRYALYYALCAASLAAEKAGLWKHSLADRVTELERAGDEWVPA